jgi:hypothetical protein
MDENDLPSLSLEAELWAYRSLSARTLLHLLMPLAGHLLRTPQRLHGCCESLQVSMGSSFPKPHKKVQPANDLEGWYDSGFLVPCHKDVLNDSERKLKCLLRRCGEQLLQCSRVRDAR